MFSGNLPLSGCGDAVSEGEGEMTGKKRFTKIRTKIFLCMVAFLIPVIVIVNISFYRTYKSDIERQVMSLADEVTTHMAGNLRASIKSLEENLVYKITASGMFDYQDNLSDASVYAIERRMESFAELLGSMGMSVKSVYVYDVWKCTFFCDDENVSHAGYADFKETQAFQYIQDNLEDLEQRRGKTVWRRFPDTPDDVYMIKNVIDPSTLQYRGILCVKTDREYLAQQIASMSNEMALYDETGGVLCAADTIADEAALYARRGEPGNEYLTTSKTVPRKKWEIVSFTSRDRVLARMLNFLKGLILFELCLTGLAVLLAAYISRNITWNISLLIESFRRINRGEEAEEVRYRSHDETAYLCERFNDMNRQLKASVEQMTWKSIQVEKAEYNALMAQMNPHFLYNTLESISSMAKLAGQAPIVESIGKLSRLLRASITVDAQEIPLVQELDYVEKYLELQRLITGERISWDIVSEEGTGEYLVPRLLLQPLVENSVIHGVDDMLGEAVVVILVRKQENVLCIEISDNGKGMEPEKIRRLLADDDPAEPEKDRAHIGIRSIQKRIWILYGRAYGLQIESSEEGTVVRVRLPAVRRQ